MTFRFPRPAPVCFVLWGPRGSDQALTLAISGLRAPPLTDGHLCPVGGHSCSDNEVSVRRVLAAGVERADPFCQQGAQEGRSLVSDLKIAARLE
jgi:hypothetical protein